MTLILDKINDSSDLKKLNSEEIKILAGELRSLIIEVVSKNGGHLAPSLGVVELTIALHKFLNLPEDKLIWDVGHQSYPHKILTGRRDLFSTLRTYGGLSGFPKPNESPCDPFIAGHSSTSISVAAGFAESNQLNGSKNKVVAVIGDGALTGGMAYEALNHAGALQLPLIVVLNDNTMSISSNVGAMSEHLASLRTSPHYKQQKERVRSVLGHLPKGQTLANGLERMKRSFKYMLTSGVLFEEMGFTYLGPVDGHDVDAVLQILKLAERNGGPVLIHAQTQKGRGYLPAEMQPDIFHGVGSFDIDTGLVKRSAGKSYTDYFSEAMLNLAEQDERICAITAAMPDGTGLAPFAERFSSRFFDVGIAEAHAVTFGAALAAAGQKPVFAVYASFLQRGYDQIIHDVCIGQAPLVLAVDRAGLVGNDGETHHGMFDLAMLRQMPNMTVLAPRDGASLQAMLAFALALDAPCALRYNRGKVVEHLTEQQSEVVLGRGEVLAEGHDIGILAIGSMVKTALAVRDSLAVSGITVGVADLRFAKPLDEGLIEQFSRKYGKLVVIEEGILNGGVGSGIATYCAEKGLSTDLLLCALPDNFVVQGSVGRLLADCGLTAEQITQRIRRRWFSDGQEGSVE